MTSFSSLAVSIRNLIFQFSDYVYKSREGLILSTLVTASKTNTGMPMNVQGVNPCGGPWKPRSLHWQLLSKLTTLNLSEKVERFTDFKPSHGLLAYSCSLTYHRPKQSFCLSNSWLAMVQELRVTQEGSSEMIMTNPVIGVLSLRSESFSTSVLSAFPFKIAQCLVPNKGNCSGHIKRYLGLASHCFLEERIIVGFNLSSRTVQDPYYIGVSTIFIIITT